MRYTRKAIERINKPGTIRRRQENSRFPAGRLFLELLFTFLADRGADFLTGFLDFDLRWPRPSAAVDFFLFEDILNICTDLQQNYILAATRAITQAITQSINQANNSGNNNTRMKLYRYSLKNLHYQKEQTQKKQNDSSFCFYMIDN